MTRWLSLLLLLTGCVPLTTARPLERGQHELGATFGGPMISAFDTVLPLPFLVVQGRSGLPRLADRAFDLSYGLNATGLAFGVVGAHVGASWGVVEQRGAVPAVTVANRLFLASDLFAEDLPGDAGRSWAANQLEVLVSWKLGPVLTYASLSEYLDFGSPALTLTPLLGVHLDPGTEGGLVFQLEARWWGASVLPSTDRVAWFPGGVGAFGPSLGVSYVFGGER